MIMKSKCAHTAGLFPSGKCRICKEKVMEDMESRYLKWIDKYPSLIKMKYTVERLMSLEKNHGSD
jgi:hypothetical protein